MPHSEQSIIDENKNLKIELAEKEIAGFKRKIKVNNIVLTIIIIIAFSLIAYLIITNQNQAMAAVCAMSTLTLMSQWAKESSTENQNKIDAEKIKISNL